MSQEAFPPLRVWDEALKAHRNYQVIRCSECEAFENMPVTSKTAMPPEMIVKRMQARGWVMGHRRRHDLCPACATKKASRNKVTRIADYLAVATAVLNDEPKEQPMQTEQPRTPTRDEKRLIILAIEDHYNDQTRGYESGWSDDKIASDLSVPRKWVHELLDKNYGVVSYRVMHVLRLKALCRRKFAEGKWRDNSGDGGRSKVVLLSLRTLEFDLLKSNGESQ